MANHIWYNCSGSKTGNWPDGEYYVSYGSPNSRQITIWLNNAAACSGIPSVKKAVQILKMEFDIIKKIDR